MGEPIDGRICTNEQCKFADTSLCVEGNDVDECPHIQLHGTTLENDEDDEGGRPPAALANQRSDGLVHFGGGEHLSVVEASTLLKARYTPIIAFLGVPGVGKTSLIAESYDAFQYGRYQSLAFAGSRTLWVFERICYKLRAASRAPEPTQDRSEILDDPFFFHLAIKANGAAGPVDILLADRSGETYRAIADTPEIANRCLELKRMATLNILMDGSQLCDPKQRTVALNECTQALQALTFQGVPVQDVPVNVIMTKLDLVDAHENMVRAHQEFDELVERLPTQCDDLNVRITPFKIAASPQNNKYPKGYGVEALVKSWVSIRPPQGTFTKPVLTGERVMSRTPSSLGPS